MVARRGPPAPPTGRARRVTLTACLEARHVHRHAAAVHVGLPAAVHPPQASQLPQYATVAAVLALMNILTMLAYATLGTQLVRAFRGSGLRWLNRDCGSLMIGLAGTLVLYRRSGA